MAGLIKRGKIYYIQWYVGKKEKRRSLRTDSLQIAKEKLRQLESARHRGEESPFPTRTKIADILSLYAKYVRTVKTAKSAQTDIYYLRQVFGPMVKGDIGSAQIYLRILGKTLYSCLEGRSIEN